MMFRVDHVVGVAASPYAKARLRPEVMHYFLGPKSFEPSIYGDREAYFSDLVKIYRQEIAELAAAGCGYLQLDDTALPCNCDPRAGRSRASRPA